MTLWASDLQSDSDLDSIRNSCDVFLTKVYLFVPFFTSFLLCGAPTLQCQFFWSMCDANFHLPQYANCSTCCLLCPTWDHCDQNLAAKIIHSHFCIWINSNVFVHLLSFGLPVLEESCLLGSGLVPRLWFGSTLRTYKMAMRGASSACQRDTRSNINYQVRQGTSPQYQ